MKDVRENFVNLWARIINREITQLNFWFLVQKITKKGNKKNIWTDMDVIGIKPGGDYISLYNVKGNLNNTPKYTPKIIAKNFIETIDLLNNAYNKNFNYNLYLIYESADRFRKKTIKEDKENYEKVLLAELNKSENIKINQLILKDLYSCIQEIINDIEKTPATTGSNSFKFENETYVYPLNKIQELKFLSIYTHYKPKKEV